VATGAPACAGERKLAWFSVDRLRVVEAPGFSPANTDNKLPWALAPVDNSLRKKSAGILLVPSSARDLESGYH
jgi:hypothetical protein